MASTVAKTVTSAAWVNISSGASAGTVTNEGSSAVKIHLAATLPDPSVSVGHTLPNGPGELYRWADETLNVYARSTGVTTVVVVTTNG